MISLEPGEFFASWNISIKAPVVIKNLLPFDLFVRYFKILDQGGHPASKAFKNNLSRLQFKDLLFEDKPHTICI
jgi:hypothetical protein